VEIKSVTKKKKKKNYDAFLAFLTSLKNGRDMVVRNSFYIYRPYAHNVEDSTLMSMFDQFRFSFDFLGLPKIGPNR